MKKLDVIVLTRQLNQLRMRNPELKVSQFKKEIATYVGYNMFASLLLEEGYAHSINGVVRFSPNPIHKSKVENILIEARELQYKYTKTYTEKKKNNKEKEEEEEKREIKEAIEFLKGKGYLVLKPECLI